MTLSAAQRAMRRTGLGSTDMVRLSGESKWGTAHDVYAEKVLSTEDDGETEATSIGTRLEPFVCELLAEKHILILTQGTTERHRKHEWALSTPDRNVMDNMGQREGVVEAKVVGGRLFAHWEDDSAPPPYVHVQAQWHMTVTGAPICYVGGLLGTEFRSYAITSDWNLSEALIEIGAKFWRDHVLARVPPQADGSDSSHNMLRSIWPRPSTGDMVRADDLAEALAAEYFAARDNAKASYARQEVLEQRLCEIIGAKTGIIGNDWKALWSTRKAYIRPACNIKEGRVFRATTKKE